jgi:L-lactate dehydrogenase
MSGAEVTGAPPRRHDADALIAWAQQLLVASRMEPALAEAVGEVLVEGDLLGHDTHGMALLAGYLGELDRGTMTASGDHGVIAERTVAATWDGRRLPGPALVRRAIDRRTLDAEIGAVFFLMKNAEHIMKKIFKIHDHLYCGLAGLATDRAENITGT